MTEKSNRFTIDELIELSKQDTAQDLIEELLPSSGYMVVGSSNGMGKSLEMLHLLCNFATDGGNYHGLKVAQCGAVYIALEDDEKKIGDRLSQIKPQYNLNYTPLIHTASNLYLDTNEGREELRRIVRNERRVGNDVRVVILDSLKYTIAGDYLRPHEAKKWTDLVKGLSKELGVAFIFVHHTRKLTMYKGEAQDLLDSDRIKGAKDIVDHAEACVLMAVDNVVRRDGATTFRPKTNIMAVVKARHAKADIEGNPITLTFDRERLCWNGQKWDISGKEVSIVGVSNAK